jgi:hypothetical protein
VAHIAVSMSSYINKSDHNQRSCPLFSITFRPSI